MTAPLLEDWVTESKEEIHEKLTRKFGRENWKQLETTWKNMIAVDYQQLAMNTADYFPPALYNLSQKQ